MPYEIEIPGRAIVEVPDDVPLEEAKRALAKQYPPTGDDIADALKTDPTFVPTKDQFKTYEAWSKTKQTDWIENIAAGVSGLLDTASKGVVAGAQGAALNPANYLEGVAQSMHQLYGMVAQSQDPDSVLFKLKDLVSGGGTDDDRYNQFLEARKYNEQAIKYAEGKETVLPKEMVNPEFAQMVALAADPLYALPGLGELLGVGKLATRATGLAAKAAGKGVEAIARPLESAIKAGADIVTETTGLGEGGLRSVAASAAGAGLAAGSPIAAGLAAAPALVSGAREVGQAIATAGENLMTQPSRIGALEAVGMAPGANLRQRVLASVGRLGGDAAIDYGLRGTAGALEGAALGAGLGYASGGEEGAAQGIGQGALQGAAGAVSARMLKQATGLAAKEARIGDFRRFVESQNDPKTAELLGQIEKQHGVDVAAGFMDLKGIVEGTLGDIPVKIQSAKDFQAEHGTARGITITMGDKPQIFINADSFKGKGDDPFYTLAHEAFHAFDQVEQLRNTTSEIKQALVGTYLDDGTGGRRLVREGLLDPADVQRRFDQYAAKFPDGHSEKARLLGLDESARTDYVAGELGSEYFGRLIRGYKPDSLLRGFSGVTRGLVDMALMQSASQSLQRIASALDSRFGVKPTDSILFPGLKEASPQLNAMLRTLVRTRKNLDEAVVKADNDPTVIRQADLSNPAAAKIAVDSGLAKTTPTGKVELLTKQEVIKQEEHTVDVIKKVIASTPITDTSQPFARIVDREAVGTVSKEQVNALLASPILPSRIKQKIALAQSLIDEGRSGFLQYAAATKDRKNKITGKIGRAYSSAIPVSAREVIPYALEISKAGNPYIQTIDLTKVRGALERSSRGDGSVGPYATMTDVFNDLARYFNNLDQGASARRSVDVFGPDKAKFLTDLVNEKRPGGTSSPFYRSFRLDRVISAAPRDYVAKVTPTSVEMAGKRWMPTERIGNTEVVNSEAGFRIIHADGKKWRLYDKSGALKGVYDTQREAEKKAARYMPSEEDYKMQHRPNQDGPPAHDLLSTDMAPRDIYSRPDFYTGEPGSAGYRESVAALRKIRGKPDALITVYRASPKNELNHGDWVSFSRSYSTQHGMADDPSMDVPVHAFKVKAKDVRWDGNTLEEFGYYPTK